jgi:Endonuclease NucS
MPVNHSIWKVDDIPVRLSSSSLVSEVELEEMICKEIGILNENWLPIGRQIKTTFGGKIDLLAINEVGNLIVVELKKNRTPRDVVSQAIDYAFWVKSLRSTDIAKIYKEYGASFKPAYESLDEAIKSKFSKSFGEDEINQAHEIVVVASELDLSTERIVKYLSEYEIPINTLFFHVFADGKNRYLSRSWLIDPAETIEHANLPKDSSARVSWNNEYYVSFGHQMGRNWDDARKYGFIGAGGKRWYSQTLDQLSKGDRVWVNIPHTGYVGVGIVEAPAVIANDFKVEVDNKMIPIINAPLQLSVKEREDYLKKYANDVENAEYFVRVKWLKSFPIKQAVKQIGFFGNQNSVCKPVVSSWVFTVDTLKKKWGIK